MESREPTIDRNLGEGERNKWLLEWNPAPRPYPESTVQTLFEKQAVERGDATALVFGAQPLTYRELNAQANRLAHHLIVVGVQPGQAVAIFLERSLEQIVATLAILKAGAVYVPLDIEFPQERIVQMLKDAQPRAILSHSSVAGRLMDVEGVIQLKLDELDTELRTHPDSNPDIPGDPDALAYIMFTSGSTGRPKGVEVMHRGIVRLVFAVDYIPYNADTVMLQIATVSFDAATFEMWGALLHGGTLVICPSRVPTLDTLGRLIAEHDVNTMLLTAAFFNLVIKESPHILKPLKYLLAGGEALSSWHVAEALRNLPEVRLVNAYGPTENSVISTTYTFDRDTFDPDRPIPIGRPIGNSSCYVLDRFMRLVPAGVTGELYVGGDGVARGYVNRPDLTAERFLADPFRTKPGARMYKTGDRVCWNQKGLLEFMGRSDNQIKLRGFRIELSEIDTVLASFPGVEQAVTVVYDDDVRGKWLAGYVKVADPAGFSVAALEQYIKEKLPDYMVPSALVPVAQWAFTPSGKLDRKALPKPLLGNPLDSVEDVRYESETEERLAQIWSGLFEGMKISRSADFFALGGDSLMAVTLFSKIHQQFKKELSLASLTQAPTLAQLALLIAGRSDAPDFSSYRSLKMIQQGAEGVVPLFMVHGGAGNILIFKEFAKNLGPKQPVYAFQWSGWDGGRGEVSIPSMARAYKRELLRFRPEGPCRVGGHCIGGLIALELARQLIQDGRKIERPIIVTDAPNVKSKTYRRRASRNAAGEHAAFQRLCGELERLKKLEHAKIVNAMPEPPSELPASGWVGQLKQLPYVYPLARALRTRARLFGVYLRTARGNTVPMEGRSWYCGQTQMVAMQGHKHHAFPGDILYFRAGCHGWDMGLPGWWEDVYLGFGELCNGHFEGHVFGGGHDEILQIPEVAELVARGFEGRSVE